MDVSFQISEDQNVKKDVQVMKVVHDFKNPIISIKQSIIDPQATLESIRQNCLHDVDDIEEMLENMRAEFKFKQGMAFSEVANEVKIEEFAKSFIPTHTQLAISGNNNFLIQINKLVPENLHIKRSLIKRIVNNFISNSLKHTLKGDVKLTFSFGD